MELGHLNQSLYPRAVTASVEGKSRQDGQGRGIHSGHTASVKKGSAAAVERERVQRQQSERRQTDQQSVNRHNAEQDPEYAGFTSASAFGDRLAVATKQARQTQTRRGYSPPALVSARGREANRRYLDASLANQSRFIDEVV